MSLESAIKIVDDHPVGLVTQRASDIEPQEIVWLWQQRIALGKLSLIAGDPGLGKSLFTIFIAATVSRGSRWPVDRTDAPLGSVLIVSAEDDPADTIVPRLDAADADRIRVHLLRCVREYSTDGTPVERELSLERDIAKIEETVAKIGDCKLIIIDPISAYLGHVDTHRNSDVRAVLAPLAKLAQRLNVAIVAVSHLNKGAGANAAYRVTGSIAFTAAVRASLLIAKDKDAPERRLVLPGKNNLGPDNLGGLAYRVMTHANGQPYLEFEKDAVTITADDALADSMADDRAHAKTEAKDFLRELLRDGPVDSKEAQKEARDAGIAPRTLDRARVELNVVCRPAASRGKWRWSLPTSPVTSPGLSTMTNMANMAKLRNECDQNSKFANSANSDTVESGGEHAGEVTNACPQCNGGGCRACDYFGRV